MDRSCLPLTPPKEDKAPLLTDAKKTNKTIPPFTLLEAIDKRNPVETLLND